MAIDTSIYEKRITKPRSGLSNTFWVDDAGKATAILCKTCNEVKSSDEFASSKITDSKHVYKCRTCYRQYGKARYEKRKITHPGQNATQAVKARRKYAERTEEQLQADLGRHHPDGTKECATCHVECEVDLFYRDITRADTLSRKCFDCIEQYRRDQWSGAWKEYWTLIGLDFESCIYCGLMTAGALNGDHVVPVALGGPDTLENIAPSCRSCNACKSGKPVEQFLEEQFFYDDERQAAYDRLRQYGYIA